MLPPAGIWISSYREPSESTEAPRMPRSGSSHGPRGGRRRKARPDAYGPRPSYLVRNATVADENVAHRFTID